MTFALNISPSARLMPLPPEIMTFLRRASDAAWRAEHGQPGERAAGDSDARWAVMMARLVRWAG